jgi:hypothetical protein
MHTKKKKKKMTIAGSEPLVKVHYHAPAPHRAGTLGIPTLPLLHPHDPSRRQEGDNIGVSHRVLPVSVHRFLPKRLQPSKGNQLSLPNDSLTPPGHSFGGDGQGFGGGLEGLQPGVFGGKGLLELEGVEALGHDTCRVGGLDSHEVEQHVVRQPEPRLKRVRLAEKDLLGLGLLKRGVHLRKKPR